MRDVYEQLIKIKADLEHYSKYSAWADDDHLLSYQRKLGEIDNLRKDGKFLAPDGSIPEVKCNL
jgi:hypothetical protein